ncbi:YcxB family protein [Kitasatospora sp. NPDC036755]|uniref:YcxB family protein n=1 Tax=Kitasatospora sp. NPDC036755 TaxID=3154600 RepID=UPI0033F05C0F
MDERVETAYAPATDERIELAYTPTVEDFREALAARARATRAGRRQRALLYLLVVCGPLIAVLDLSAGKGIGFPPVIMVLAALALLFWAPRLQAGQFHKMTADKGEFTATVETSGVTIANRHSTSTLTWQAVPHHVETPRLFVLVSGDKNNACLAVLPKRGTADPDRLRAVLARHAPAPTRG